MERRQPPSLTGFVIVLVMLALVWAIFHGARPLAGKYRVFEWNDHHRR
jgi:hypothetical protein